MPYSAEHPHLRRGRSSFSHILRSDWTRLLPQGRLSRARRKPPPMDLTSIQAAYRRYARVYDATFGAVFAAGRKRILTQLNRHGGQRILEVGVGRSEEHTSELQSLMRSSYDVFCLKK